MTDSATMLDQSSNPCLTAELVALRTPDETPAEPVLVAESLVEAESLVVATLVDGGTDKPVSLGWRLIRFVLGIPEWLFGAAALILGLSFLATIPILQFLSLGYLLEASGRIGRTRKFTAGFVGVRKAARVGSIVFGAYLLLLPLRLATSVWYDARIIDPGGAGVRISGVILIVLSVYLVGHILGSWFRGGRWRHYLVPWNIFWLPFQLVRPGAYSRARDAMWEFVVGLRLPYYFWLGARGFVGGLAWLLIPISMLALTTHGAPLLGFLIPFTLPGVMMLIPILQTRFAVENRFAALFDVEGAIEVFARAPIAFFLAFVSMLAFALPLHLLKIEMIPREAAWLPSLLFVTFIFPARLLTGWAYSRAAKRKHIGPWQVALCFPSMLSMFAVSSFFVLIVFFTQFTHWHGVWALYEQHQFLVPVPFLGM